MSITAAELSRRLLGRDLTPGDYHFVQNRVRALLTELGCPRGEGYRPPYEVDRAMERDVRRIIGRQA